MVGPDNIDEFTELFITSAVNFKANWKYPF